MRNWILAGSALFALTAASEPVRVSKVAAPARAPVLLPSHVGGRVVAGTAPGSYLRQWPGTYFETAVQGESVLFRVGSGDVRLHVTVDGTMVDTLVKPAAGFYRIGGMGSGKHRLRIEVASESQAGPTEFGGFFSDGAARAVRLDSAARQIEFIGDSHTVGYANTSTKTDCTQEEVWQTTDSSLGFGPTLARAEHAQYRIHAISGRGVVRNYNGFAAAKMPEAYAHALFDRDDAAVAQPWAPQVIVIALGTNDFTTALHEGEPWKDRAALHASYEDRYVAFVQDLRARYPGAFFVLWATDMAEGEIKAEVARVAERLKAQGERRLAYLPIDGLALSACHGHPSLADDREIARRIGEVIDAQPDVWKK